MQLPDLQNSKDNRNTYIKWVGISNYKIPTEIEVKEGGNQSTISTIEMYTDLPSTERGAHMSRYSQIIEEAVKKTSFAINILEDVLLVTKSRLEAKNARITVQFPYFIKKEAPISKIKSHFLTDCSFHGILENNKVKLFLEVEVLYTCLCPCSKEMSLISKNTGLGAHNQRGLAKVKIGFKNLTDFVWIEDIIAIIENSVSCPIYNTLKRKDEKFVTEKAYNNPVFCEDVLRNIVIQLKKLKEINQFRIYVKHFESIHQSNAIAETEESF